MLSAIIVQVKYKAKADTMVENEIRPLGIARDLHNPLPYVAFLIELGNESRHRQTGTKVKSTAWEKSSRSYSELVQDWMDALNRLKTCKAQERPNKSRVDALKKEVEMKRSNMECYKRYSISARGASDAYGISQMEQVQDALQTLLHVALPSPPGNSTTLKRMRPLGRLGDAPGYTDSMAVHILTTDDFQDSLTGGAGLGLTVASLPDLTPSLSTNIQLPSTSSSHMPIIEGQ